MLYAATFLIATLTWPDLIVAPDQPLVSLFSGIRPDASFAVRLLSSGPIGRDWIAATQARLRCLGRARICDLRPVHSRPRCQHVSPHANAARDLACRDAPDQECVRNQGSMAAPGDGLGAHQHDSLPLRQIDASVQVPSERRGLHVVRISTKTRISPATVRGVRARVPQATQARHVSVMDPSAAQSRRQLVAIELRVMSRSRDGTHVDHSADPVCLEQPDELFNRPSRVPDRQDDQRCHSAPRSRHSSTVRIRCSLAGGRENDQCACMVQLMSLRRL